MQDVHDVHPPEPATASTETLTIEISTLWSTHQLVQTTAKHSREELQGIRPNLGLTVRRVHRRTFWAGILR